MKENYIYKIWKKYKNLVFICLDSDMYVGIDKGILIPEILEMNICLVIYSSFHILFLEDFLGPSLYTDVHLHSHVMGSKKMKLTCQWFHTAKNLEQVVTQKIWIQSGFSLSIMIPDLHLIRQFRASLMMKANTWIYVYLHDSKPFIGIIWFHPQHSMRWVLVIGLFYSWEDGDLESSQVHFPLAVLSTGYQFA